jgi:hypothetical protein
MRKSHICYLFFFSTGVIIPIVSSLFTEKFGLIVSQMAFNKDIQINLVFQVLTVLLIIAVFVERALEVYMITFRKPGEFQYENNGSLKSGSKNTDMTLEEYKHETSKIALFSALTIGIIISMTGIRGIEPFVSFAGANHWQSSWFRISDILLTGGVIAGGSEVIHQMLQVITTFMNNVTTNNKSTEAETKATIATSKASKAEAETRTTIAELTAAETIAKTGAVIAENEARKAEAEAKIALISATGTVTGIDPATQQG